MVLAAAMPAGEWEIVGTDMSTRVVETLRRGLYPVADARQIPRPLLRRSAERETTSTTA